MKAPPRRKGNTLSGLLEPLATERLNESPSKKEGKFGPGDAVDSSGPLPQ